MHVSCRILNWVALRKMRLGFCKSWSSASLVWAISLHFPHGAGFFRKCSGNLSAFNNIAGIIKRSFWKWMCSTCTACTDTRHVQHTQAEYNGVVGAMVLELGRLSMKPEPWTNHKEVCTRPHRKSSAFFVSLNVCSSNPVFSSESSIPRIWRKTKKRRRKRQRRNEEEEKQRSDAQEEACGMPSSEEEGSLPASKKRRANAKLMQPSSGRKPTGQSLGTLLLNVTTTTTRWWRKSNMPTSACSQGTNSATFAVIWLAQAAS